MWIFLMNIKAISYGIQLEWVFKKIVTIFYLIQNSN
jgi:hypothetical protein